MRQEYRESRRRGQPDEGGPRAERGPLESRLPTRLEPPLRPDPRCLRGFFAGADGRARGGTLALRADMRALAILAVFAVCPTLTVAQDVPTFAQMSWGSRDADVIKAATTAGLQLVKHDEDGDYEFSGEVFGAPAVVYAFMSPSSGLVKVQVRVATPEDRPVSKYVEVIGSLTEQYGKTEQVELFKTPYKKGDGLIDEAVRSGKALLLSAWGDDRQPGQASLIVRVTKLVVGLDYESHDWSAELTRRKEQVAAGSGLARGGRAPSAWTLATRG